MNYTKTTITEKNVYTTISREDVNQLRRGQTVLIECNFEKGDDGVARVTSKRVFLGNYERRSDGYYNCFIADGYRHKRLEHEYRLLKLYRCLEEIDNQPDIQVEYLKSSLYKEDPVTAAPKEVAPAPEEVPTPEVSDVSNDVPAEAFGEVEVNEAVVTIVEEPKEGKKKGGKAKKGDKKK